jgi:hypothetical protein
MKGLEQRDSFGVLQPNLSSAIPSPIRTPTRFPDCGMVSNVGQDIRMGSEEMVYENSGMVLFPFKNLFH